MPPAKELRYWFDHPSALEAAATGLGPIPLTVRCRRTRFRCMRGRAPLSAGSGAPVEDLADERYFGNAPVSGEPAVHSLQSLIASTLLGAANPAGAKVHKRLALDRGSK